MHLVKWIRKNMGKLMAIFVILIMIAFIMPSLLNEWSKFGQGDRTAAMYTYGQDKNITNKDLQQAAAELSILRGLMADRFLLAQRDVRPILLGQLLFPESENGALISDELKNMAMQSGLHISPLAVDQFFSQSRGRSELFYILLKHEAEKAGCAVTPKYAGDILNMIIPQLTNKQIDTATLVNNLASSTGMSDEQVLKTFANVLSIMAYARIVTETENVTFSELENTFARQNERMDVNLIEFAAEDFTDKVPAPTDAQITGQFEKFKNEMPGTITEENPVGFGYKLPARVALDYMIIKVGDLKKNVAAPTEEEVEEYYRQNLEQFTTEEPQDPNDPNSKTVKKQKSYAEVADMIKKGLHARKVNSLGSKILGQAIEQTDSGLESLDFEKTSVETLKSKAGDYAATAETLSKEHNIKVYTGRTSLLTPSDLQSDQSLGSLAMAGQSRMPTRLVKLVFAVNQLGDEAAKLGPFEPPAPKMFVSVGPLSDMANEIMAVVRVVDTAKSQAPESADFSYVKNLPKLDDSNSEPAKFVLKDDIIEDCKKLAAAEIADKAANEFLDTVKKENWDKAIAKINSQYGKKDSADPNAKTFDVRPMTNLKRISAMDVELTKIRISGMMGAESVVDQTVIYGKLVDTLFDKYQQVQENKLQPPFVVDFDPKLTLYVVKDIKAGSPGTTEDFESMRQQLALQQDFLDAQSTAFDFYMPDNITQRNDLKVVEGEKAADVNDANGEKK